MAEQDKFWDFFWEKPTSGFEEIMKKSADAFVLSFLEQIPLNKTERLLDFGAGTGDILEIFLKHFSHVFGYDKSSYIIRKLEKRFQENDQVTIIKDLEVMTSSCHDMDCIFLNSVIQYMSLKELQDLLVQFKQILAPEGILIISDIIPPRYSRIADTFGLIQTTLHKGFLPTFVKQIVQSILKNPFMQTQMTLAQYSEEGLHKLLNENGFKAERLASNLHLSRHRFSLVVTIKK
jgi:cyclopropane fatty-acyl-phospholipid synthase-like methyltransferase